MALEGKRVVAIGGTMGIGLGVAEAASAAGASVVVASSRRASVDKALTALPAGTEGHMVDVSDEKDVARFFDEVGAFDHLVFTAGDRVGIQPLKDVAIAEAHQLFTVRFWGALAAAKHGVQHIREGGSMVFTTGTSGRRPYIPVGTAVGGPLYAGIEAMIRSLALELAPVRVNAVAAGVVRTPLTTEADPEGAERFFAQHGPKLPVGRVADPSDVAKAYVYLMSDGFCTGHVLVSDGGQLLI
ncbi:SDR family oxidoreductase [Streptomyces caniscabiei]|uniref:SDR family oxidoreductase n=1 Tax=Streptomyces caniscabiei TaxID=2746961 RepID=UPI000765B48C|nr:SDR family oxidoreductase [Streptomyces caniscabiei]